jgi:hypothetical protein
MTVPDRHHVLPGATAAFYTGKLAVGPEARRSQTRDIVGLPRRRVVTFTVCENRGVRVP